MPKKDMCQSDFFMIYNLELKHHFHWKFQCFPIFVFIFKKHKNKNCFGDQIQLVLNVATPGHVIKSVMRIKGKGRGFSIKDNAQKLESVHRN